MKYVLVTILMLAGLKEIEAKEPAWPEDYAGEVIFYCEVVREGFIDQESVTDVTEFLQVPTEKFKLKLTMPLEQGEIFIMDEGVAWRVNTMSSQHAEKASPNALIQTDKTGGIFGYPFIIKAGATWPYELITGMSALGSVISVHLESGDFVHSYHTPSASMIEARSGKCSRFN